MSERFDNPRRQFLRQVGFGLVAAGTALGPWAAPALASVAPPVALAGSVPGPSVQWGGDQIVQVAFKQQKANVDLFLKGNGDNGLWKVDATVGDLPDDVAMSVEIRPKGVAFHGNILEAHKLIATMRISGSFHANPVKTKMLEIPLYFRAVSNDESVDPVDNVVTMFLRY